MNKNFNTFNVAVVMFPTFLLMVLPSIVFASGDMLDLAKVCVSFFNNNILLQALDVAVITAMKSGQLQQWVTNSGFGNFAVAKVILILRYINLTFAFIVYRTVLY